ncbi:hypothetical protein D3C84_1262140 [compost metagenome]
MLGSCEDGSVGSQIAGWLDLAFPGRTIEQIRGVMSGTPGAFHAVLHAAADMGDAE